MSAVRGRRLVALYAATLTAGAVVVVLALTAGGRIDAAPQLAAHTTVDGEAAECLGPQVVAIQSGIHLGIHSPGSSGIDGPVGQRLLRGEVDIDQGNTTMDGRCAAGTPLAGRGAVARLAIRQGAAAGTIEVGQHQLTATLAPGQAGSEQPVASEEPLEGGDLLGRSFLAVAVILVAARVVGLLFGRIRLTRVMGEIVAGILLGPSLLGALWPEASQYLFPPSVTSVLEVVGQFGLIFFMFLVGLELNHRLVRGLGHQVVLLSHVSIIVPFAIGTALAVGLYPGLGSGRFTGFALFMGAAMAITAFPVLARILSDTGLNRTPLGALAITCAAVDDLTAWCILATVVAVVGSTGAAGVATTLVLTAGFVGLMVFVGRPLLRRIAISLQRQGRLSAALVPSVLVGVLISAWATEMIGIHAIFGAFVFGVVMPRPPWLKADLQGRLEDITLLFLLPIFFAVVGLSTRIALLDSLDLWLVTGAVIAAAVVGKLGGSMFAARVGGYGWRQSTALGLLMNTRGLTEIVILTVGQSLGVISPALFVILVLMALATTLMATPLLSMLYPASRIEGECTERTESERSRRPHHGRDVLAWLTGRPNDTAIFDLATAVAEGRRVDVQLLQHGNEAHLADALDGAAVVVVSATGLDEELARDGRVTELLATTDATVLVVRDGSEGSRTAVELLPPLRAERVSTKGTA